MQLKFSRKWVLFVFMLGTFAIGMTEYVVTGLLTQFASDLKVEVATTGLLLSAYAISVAIFGPLLRIMTIKLPSKPLLIGLMIVFVISNTVAATAPNFETLLASRLFSAVMHAPFFGLCMSLAVHISPPNRRTGAIAAVQGGLTVAVMLGVPFGSYLGGLFDWRSVFWFITIIGCMTLVGLMIVTPNIESAEKPKLKKELQMFKNKTVLLAIAIIIFGYSGVFTAYTFMEPMIRTFAGFDVTGVTITLLAFGIGAVLGNFVSAKVQEERLTEQLMLTLGILAVVLVSLTFLLQFSITAICISFLFGAGTFGTTPILNSKIILAAKEAPMLSGTIAASVFNIANFVGATLGTLLLDVGLTYPMITFIAAGIIGIGLLLTLVTHKVEDKSLFQS